MRTDNFTEEWARSHKQMENSGAGQRPGKAAPQISHRWGRHSTAVPYLIPDACEPFRGPSLRGLGFFDQRLLPHHNHDSRIGYVKSPLVGFHVVANLRAFGQRHVAVDNGAANA